MKMKRILAGVIAVMALAGLMVGSVFALPADKLVVKDSTGINTKFVVRDDGTIGVNVPAPVNNFDLSSAGVWRSSMHFSVDGTPVGGWITSVLANNFFLSSGAEYVQSLGGWIQRSSDGYSGMVGTQTFDGYTLFLQSGGVVGSPITPQPVFQVFYNGSIGMGRTADPTKAIISSTGAYLSTGGVWTNASSRSYKDNIRELSSEEASKAVKELNPVTFTYKVDAGEQHAGFIAEDVPALVATKDRKGLSPMDIVAVLTKVVQEQSKTIEALSAKIEKIEKAARNSNSF